LSNLINYFADHNIEAFEAIMILAISHAYGCFNPKQLADFLGVNHQKIYTEISSWTLYKLQKVLKLIWYSFSRFLELSELIPLTYLCQFF